MGFQEGGNFQNAPQAWAEELLGESCIIRSGGLKFQVFSGEVQQKNKKGLGFRVLEAPNDRLKTPSKGSGDGDVEATCLHELRPRSWVILQALRFRV